MLRGLLGEIDELASLDPTLLCDSELHEVVIGLQRATARLEAAKTRIVGEWSARRLWADDGSKAPGARLARDAHLSGREGFALARRARKLAFMPTTAAAFAAGELSVDHVDALCRVNVPALRENFWRDEEMLVSQAKTLSYPQWTKALAYWQYLADPDGARLGASRDEASRYCDAARSFRGVIDVRARLPRLRGTAFVEELARLEERAYRADLAEARSRLGRADVCTEDLRRSPTQRRADALVEMATRSAAVLKGARKPRPLISVLVGYESFAGAISELEDGTLVTDAEVVSLLAEADVERIVFGARSRVIDVGVRERFFTGALRRAIEVRDRHCQYPGCDMPARRCDVDHIVPHPAGGLTTQDNGRLLCATHNRNPDRRRAPPPDEGAA